jgi:hypothetical protein
MSNMSRPRFYGWTQAALAAWVTLAAGACGKGLFNTSPLDITTRDGGSGVDRVDGVHPAADVQVLPTFDLSPGDLSPLQDLPSDSAEPGSSTTKTIGNPDGAVTLGQATFSVDTGAFAQPTPVTLTWVEDSRPEARYPGPIGPIFEVTKAGPLRHQATFDLSFTPPDGIPLDRVVLAYFDIQANPNLWIAISQSSYDQTAGVLTGSVVEFSDTRLFAPVESCLTGQACPDPEACGGGACQ